jgi:hypothetical protein
VIWDDDTFAVADPTQLQSVVRVTINREHGRVISHDSSVTVVSTDRQLVVDINVTGSFGATHTFTVR